MLKDLTVKSGEKRDVFSQHFCSTLYLMYQPVQQYKEKKKNTILAVKEDTKLSLFVDIMTIYKKA